MCLVTLSLRSYRTTIDGDRTVFFAMLDREAPLVHGGTIVGRTADLDEVFAAADQAGLTLVDRRWPDDRRALLVQDRRQEVV